MLAGQSVAGPQLLVVVVSTHALAEQLVVRCLASRHRRIVSVAGRSMMASAAAGASARLGALLADETYVADQHISGMS